MATPLRKAAGGYEAYAVPRPNAEPRRKRDTTSKRLVSRQIRSNAELRHAIAWVALAMSSVLFLMSITSIFVKAGVSQLNYNINSIQNENTQILLENDRIRGQIAELRSLDRIEAIATEELGMVKNEEVEYMVLSSTIVAEGKIRSIVEEAEPEKEVVDPLAKLVAFLRTWRDNLE